MRSAESFMIFAVNNSDAEARMRAHGYRQAEGYYKGQAEISFIAPLGDAYALRVAAAFNQESVLMVENGAAFLRFLDDGSERYLGRWTWAKDARPAGDAWTRVPGIGFFEVIP
jgi:hypothetical protein